MKAIEDDLVIVYDNLNESYQISGTARNQENPTFPAGFYQRNTTVEVYYFVGTKLNKDIFELVTLEDEPNNSGFINFLEFIGDADIPLLSFVTNLVSIGSQYLAYQSYIATWKLKSSEVLPLDLEDSIKEQEEKKPLPIVSLGLIGAGLFTGMLPLTIFGTGLLFLNNRRKDNTTEDSSVNPNITNFSTQEVVETETLIDQYLG